MLQRLQDLSSIIIRKTILNYWIKSIEDDNGRRWMKKMRKINSFQRYINKRFAPRLRVLCFYRRRRKKNLMYSFLIKKKIVHFQPIYYDRVLTDEDFKRIRAL